MIEKTNGDYIAFCDGDDCVMREFISAEEPAQAIETLRGIGWIVEDGGDCTCPACQIREARGEHLV